VLYPFSSRLLLFAAFTAAIAFGQSPAPEPIPDADSAAPTKSAEIQPDLTDPSVVRAQLNMDRIRGLVRQGVLPPLSLTKAQDELNDALDMSILRFSASTSDLLPEQADQMVTVAERMFLRRQRRATQNAQLAANGVISRSEAEASGGDVMSAKVQLDLAIDRARLVKDLAAQKALAQVETDAETHPELAGKLYARYDGNGVFTRADFDRLSVAYLATFGHPIPVSADGQTEVHRAMGLNHAGRIDVALTPDQPEGVWLLRYLERHHIPYYAFRAAVAHKATGAHIHLGTGSARLAAVPVKACCGSW
jgi:hypothetical protein